MTEAIASQATDSPWMLRPFDPKADEGAVYYHVMKGLGRSRAGRLCGWDDEGTAQDAGMWKEHRPLIAKMIERGCVGPVVCDKDAPEIVAALALYEPDEPVCHWLGVRRSFWQIAGAELATMVLPWSPGTRVRVTLECGDLRSLALGGKLPYRLVPDPTYLWRHYGDAAHR